MRLNTVVFLVSMLLASNALAEIKYCERDDAVGELLGVYQDKCLSQSNTLDEFECSYSGGLSVPLRGWTDKRIFFPVAIDSSIEERAQVREQCEARVVELEAQGWDGGFPFNCGRGGGGLNAVPNGNLGYLAVLRMDSSPCAVGQLNANASSCVLADDSCEVKSHGMCSIAGSLERQVWISVSSWYCSWCSSDWPSTNFCETSFALNN